MYPYSLEWVCTYYLYIYTYLDTIVPVYLFWFFWACHGMPWHAMHGHPVLESVACTMRFVSSFCSIQANMDLASGSSNHAAA